MKAENEGKSGKSLIWSWSQQPVANTCISESYLKKQMRQVLVKVYLIFFKHFLLYLRNSYFTTQVDL